jgi:hypothetical protein
MAVSLVVCGLLVGCMIGISLYGARTLPADARIPLHYGFRAYNNFASKTIGLIMWPAVGVVIFAINAAIEAGAVKPNHGSPSASQYILPLVLVVVAPRRSAPSRRRWAHPGISCAEPGQRGSGNWLSQRCRSPLA